MTKNQLKKVCKSVLGEFWQAELARGLSVNRRTVRRWASGELPITKSTEAFIKLFIKTKQENNDAKSTN